MREKEDRQVEDSKERSREKETRDNTLSTDFQISTNIGEARNCSQNQVRFGRCVMLV